MADHDGPIRRVVDAAKIRNYLLAANHPVGRWKADFFGSLGYDQSDWRALERDLLALSERTRLERSRSDEFGVRWLQRGPLAGPNGRTATIVMVWICRADERTLRFVTAFPE